MDQNQYTIPPPSYFPSSQDIEHDSESIPLDLQCYCSSCESRRQTIPTLKEFLIHGVLYCPLLLLWNVIQGFRSYLKEKKSQEGLKFSETITYDDQRINENVNLVNISKLSDILSMDSFNYDPENQDDGNLVYGVMFHHYQVSKNYFKFVWWSALGLMVWVLIIGLACSLSFGSSSGVLVW
ncbi:hypothetical protein WICPIJ_003735 [Wickerhamomyces pijperi]|uniref:Uncharacterized protein n=1 Tax=Wickerhamomyces pijperi TaxID=599730 RepID=A0A9P8TNE9_WICPI|nr:hypothetical protein WICPIJ_003735 [Wickerhamomyces pijperi]